MPREFQDIAAELRRGRHDCAALEEAAMRALTKRGWQPDYVAIRPQADLTASTECDAMVVLAAARVGSTRLLDNVEVSP